MRRIINFIFRNSKKSVVSMLSLLLFILFIPHFANGAEEGCYYIQVASFRTENRAVIHAKNLNNMNQNAVINYEEVKDKGSWYRVYVGPFSTKKQADLRKVELKQKAIADYAFIHKKDTPIKNNMVRIAAAKKTMDEKGALYAQSAVKKAPQKDEKSPKISPKKGMGRNILKDHFALGLKHTFIEVETELTKRMLTTFDGATTSVTEIPVESAQKNSFPTSFHMDHLYLRYGLTEYLETFAMIGIAYDSPSGIKESYGGGLRLNIFEVDDGSYQGIYGAVQGEYLRVNFEKEYRESGGNLWQKRADIQAVTAGMELGIKRSKYIVYGGGRYFYYREDTERLQLENLPATLLSAMYQDELEEKDKYGVFGGFTYYLTPCLLLGIEGQYGNSKSGLATLEYHF